MAFTIASQIRGNVVVFQWRSRIVFGDEGAVFRERVRSELTGTSKIVIDLSSGLCRQRRTRHSRRALHRSKKSKWRYQAGVPESASPTCA